MTNKHRQEQAFNKALTAYLSKNDVPPEQLPQVFETFRAMFGMSAASPASSAKTTAPPAPKAQVPAFKARATAEPAEKPKTKAKGSEVKAGGKAAAATARSAEKRKAKENGSKQTEAMGTDAKPSNAAATGPENNAPFLIEVPIATAAIRKDHHGGTEFPGVRAPGDPFVPIKRSVQHDYIICLEDGKKLKMLKRHLRATYGHSPESYRTKWGLPPDYPMVAPGYSEEKSLYAKAFGLGTAANKASKRTTPAALSRRVAKAV